MHQGQLVRERKRKILSSLRQVRGRRIACGIECNNLTREGGT